MSIQIRDNASLSINKNYIFYFESNFQFESKNDFFAHIVNVNMFIIQICNVINTIITINKHAKLKDVLNYEKKKNYYVTSSKNVHLIIKFKKSFKKIFKLTLIDLIVTFILTIKFINQTIITFFNVIVVNNVDVSFITSSSIILKIVTI